jgi:hypothetical protein
LPAPPATTATALLHDVQACSVLILIPSFCSFRFP